MPTVPRYPTSPIQQAALPSVRVSSDAPIEAFGGGPTQAGVGTAAQGVLSSVQDYVFEEKKKADQVAVMAADKSLSEEETRIQIQSSKMLGRDAAAAPDFAQSQWSDSVQKVRDSLSNDAQRMALDRSANTRYESLNKNVQLHTSNQLGIYDDSETKGYLDTSRNAAVLNAMDDARVNQELDRQKLALSDWATRKGIPADSAQFKDKLSSELSDTHKMVIASRLDSGLAGNVELAQKYFADHRQDMTGTDIIAAEKEIDKADTRTMGNDAWSKVSQYQLADGVPDEARMQAAVMSTPGLSDEKKEKIWEIVKAKAGEYRADKSRADSANDRDFMNQLLAARKQGADLDGALVLANRMGRDDYDTALKEEAVKKVYAPPTESDPGTYIRLWEGVQDRSLSRLEIDAAYKANHINTGDWRGLREAYYNANTVDNKPEVKAAWERVKILSEDTFGSDNRSKERFLYEMHSSTQGMSPEEIWKSANDKLKSDASTTWRPFGFDTGLGADKQWQTDVSKRDAQNTAWGKLYGDIGQQEATAIGQGVLSKGRPTWGLGDVDAFATELGGYDKMKPGTPAHNAIQSLVRRKQLVTPANVKAVLEKHADGNF